MAQSRVTAAVVGSARGLLACGREVGRAVVPVVCPGCGLPDSRWCEACAAPWWDEPWRSESGAGRLDVEGAAPLPVWSIVSLEGPARLMIAAWKDGARRDLDGFFAEAARRAARWAAPSLPMVRSVVPVPARRRSIRRRGVDLPAMLAAAAVCGLADAGLAATVELALDNRGGEARALGMRGRWENARRGIRIREPPRRGGAVLLVDDVVTTGASLARSCEVLEAAGVAVVGAITLAAVPARNPGPPSRW